MIEQINSASSFKDIDQQEFGELVESHRRELQVHCYRMLGSVQEADDMVQETFWRAWDRRETYQGRSTLRAWLYRIATNLCIDTLRQRPRRALPITHAVDAASPDQPVPASINEPIWLEPFPFDQPGPEDDNPEAKYSTKESVKLAFLASIHLLPPQQRAVLILRDVLDWRGDEVAEALGQTVPSVKSALHRARTTLAQHQHNFSQNLSEQINEESLRRQLDCYVRAWENADVDALVSLLRNDATFSMPPIPSWYSGRENIASLVSKTIFSGQAKGRWRLVATRANSEAGYGLYRLNGEKGIYDAYGVQVVTFNGDLIADITTFRNPALLAHFDLPCSLAA